jgi:hypothetical protein
MISAVKFYRLARIDLSKYGADAGSLVVEL